MAFITVDQLRQRLASMLRIDATDGSVDAASIWQTILTDAVSWGYQEILGALAARGYSKSQIDAWPRGTEFNVSLGLFWSLTQGAGLHSYDDKFLNKLDRREELKAVVVLDDTGALMTPAGAGRFTVGDYTTDKDIFVLDPDDPNLGQVTDW